MDSIALLEDSDSGIGFTEKSLKRSSLITREKAGVLHQPESGLCVNFCWSVVRVFLSSG